MLACQGTRQGAAKWHMRSTAPSPISLQDECFAGVSQSRDRASARNVLYGLARRCGGSKEEDMKRLVNIVRTFVRDNEGQDLVEYALLVALISLGATVAVTAAGNQIEAVFDAIVDALPLP
jgi:Flp pilus assembly pilin Flp